MQFSTTVLALVAAVGVSAAPGSYQPPCTTSTSTVAYPHPTPYGNGYNNGYTKDYNGGDDDVSPPGPEPTDLAPVNPPQEGEGFALKIKSFWHWRLNNQFITGQHIGAAIDLAVPSGFVDQKTFFFNTTGGYEHDGVHYGSLDYRVNPSVPYKAALQSDTGSSMSAFTLSVLPPLTNIGFTKKGQLTLGGKSNFYVCEIPTSYGVKHGLAWKSGKKADKKVMKKCKGVRIYKA